MSSSSRAGELRVDEPAPGVTRLTVSNPQRRGALDVAVLQQLAEVVPQLDAHCLILTGEGTTFSAGYDLSGLAEADLGPQARRLVTEPFAAAVDAVAAYPYPTIAALNGHAIGGGLELALACDLRIAASGARFAMPPARLGVVYSASGIRRFIATIGAARTRELFLAAGRIDAPTAAAWGLVSSVCAEEQLADTAVAMASEMASLAPLSQRGNKRVIDALARSGGRLSDDEEAELAALRDESYVSADFQEGVRAFAQKRAPRWSGQ